MVKTDLAFDTFADDALAVESALHYFCQRILRLHHHFLKLLVLKMLLERVLIISSNPFSAPYSQSENTARVNRKEFTRNVFVSNDSCDHVMINLSENALTKVTVIGRGHNKIPESD